ncbi:unnamed protein product, partial [Meganyctiphanes norvegica]
MQTFRNITSSEFSQFSAVYYGKFWSKSLLIFFLTVIIMRQIIQLLYLQSNSYKGLSILLEIVLTVFTIIVCTNIGDKEHLDGWRLQLCVITILLAWLQITVLVGHMPGIGIYVHLFRRVCSRMLWFSLVFLSPLVGFGVCFHLLFEDSSFHPLPTALLKTLAMMVGELDIGNLIGDDNNTTLTTTVSVLSLAFVIPPGCIIIRLNQIIRLNDIAEMQKDAGVRRLALTVEHEEHVDIILYHPLVSRVLPRKLVRWLRRQFSLLEHIPAYPMPLNQHNPWLSSYDTLKSGNLRGGTLENYSVMVYPNNQVKPGRIYQSSVSSPPIQTSYMLPPWIVTNIRLLMQKMENKKDKKCKENLNGCCNQDIQKQISDLQSSVALMTQLLNSKNKENC